CLARWLICTRSSARATRSLRSLALISSRYVSGSSTFSATVRSPIRLKAWKMKPIWRLRTRARSAGDSVSTRWPASSYTPPLGASSRPRIESNVVLPQPEGPAIATYSPLSIAKLMSESACVSTSSVVKTFLMPSIRISVVILASLDAYAIHVRVLGHIRQHHTVPGLQPADDLDRVDRTAS